MHLESNATWRACVNLHGGTKGASRECRSSMHFCFLSPSSLYDSYAVYRSQRLLTQSHYLSELLADAIWLIMLVNSNTCSHSCSRDARPAKHRCSFVFPLGAKGCEHVIVSEKPYSLWCVFLLVPWCPADSERLPLALCAFLISIHSSWNPIEIWTMTMCRTMQLRHINSSRKKKRYIYKNFVANTKKNNTFRTFL